MEKLAPIPIPPAQKWRHFRLTKAPAIVFVLTLISVVFAWRLAINPGAFQGEILTLEANVSSPQDGSLGKLLVGPFEEIASGQAVAEVVLTRPEIVQATLDVIRAEIELIRIETERGLDQAQTVFRFEQLRLDWLRQKVDLVDAKARLQQAENTARRNRELNESGIVSVGSVEVAEADWVSLREQIREQEQTMDEVRETLGRFAGRQTSWPGETADSLMLAAIEVQEKNLALLELEMKPITLLAPISGQISQIHHQSGESVMAGDPILTISSGESDHILAFIPQPLRFEPRVGMPVEVRKRNGIPGKMIQSEVVGVGNRIQSTTNRFVTLHSSMPLTGLPVLIHRPVELSARPGETVDLKFLY